MIFRTKEAKKYLIRSWNRPDRPFFAAGACHVLAAAFLEIYPEAGYFSVLIRPETGFHGTHLIVSNGRTIFDYHGYTGHDVYFVHYFKKIRRFFPEWQGQLMRLKESPISPSFCQKYQHRLPDQYLHDPLQRAFSFLKRFPSPHLLEADPSTSSG